MFGATEEEHNDRLSMALWRRWGKGALKERMWAGKLGGRGTDYAGCVGTMQPLAVVTRARRCEGDG
jgi:hypothetical protein